MPKKPELTNEVFLDIAEKYLYATRSFHDYNTYKYTKTKEIGFETNRECYKRYLAPCSSLNPKSQDCKKRLFKEHGIKSIQVCISEDYKTVRYKINDSTTVQELKMNLSQSKKLKQINERLQTFK